MGAAAAEMAKGTQVPQDPLLKSLEHTLGIAEQKVLEAEQQLQQRQQRRDQLRAQVQEVRGELGIAANPDEAPPHDGSLTQGIRDLLKERSKESDLIDRTLTVKDIEHAVWSRGYRSGASRFYWAVNGTLRAMADVVVLVKEGETSRFGLKDALPRAPQGWRMVENPRRTTSASRRPGGTTDAKARGRGR